MPTMKITEIIHIIFSLIVHQTIYQGPRVSVDVSVNLILCCKPQICCLALRAAPISWRAEGWVPPFGRKGAHQDGRSAGFAWCNPDPNGRTCPILRRCFAYLSAGRGPSPNGAPFLSSVYSKWAESQIKNQTRTPNPGVVSESPPPALLAAQLRHCVASSQMAAN